MNSTRDPEPGTIRLQVYLSRSGVSSRREAVNLIESGRIEVNGVVVSEAGARVRETDEVLLDGERLRVTKTHVYLAFNKPEGVICTHKDPQGRQTAVSMIQPLFSQRLVSAGRLDLKSNGLLLITSDGRMADRISHPSSAIEKEYTVETQQEIPREMLDKWKKGIVVEGVKYKLEKYYLKAPRQVNLILHEGKNREIRNVFAEYRITVRRLTRIRIGNIHLMDLPAGAFRKYQVSDFEALLKPAPKAGPKKMGA